MKIHVPRVRLSAKEYELLQRLRGKEIESEESHEALRNYCEENQIPFTNVNHYWHKGKNFSLHVKNDLQPTYMDMRDDIISEMKTYAPEYKTISRQSTNTDSHLFIVDPADIHVGKLSKSFEVGAEYNAEIAVNRVNEGVEGLVQKSAGFSIDQILLIIGNDVLHTDNPKRTTTNGTSQDTDGMWYENFIKAKQMYIDIIEKLLSIADVHIVFNPSNHDYMSGFFLADSIFSWFAKCDNVTFDVSIVHRKYYKYHNNLIGSTHGDGAKEADLPLLMAHEASEHWASCKHKYIYTHHLHHNRSKDYMGVNIQIMRSPSEADAWHMKSGYAHAPKAVEAFLHHKIHGRIASFCHIF
jgi:hypothetical protein